MNSSPIEMLIEMLDNKKSIDIKAQIANMENLIYDFKIANADKDRSISKMVWSVEMKGRAKSYTGGYIRLDITPEQYESIDEDTSLRLGIYLEI